MRRGVFHLRVIRRDVASDSEAYFPVFPIILMNICEIQETCGHLIINESYELSLLDEYLKRILTLTFW